MLNAEQKERAFVLAEELAGLLAISWGRIDVPVQGGAVAYMHYHRTLRRDGAEDAPPGEIIVPAVVVDVPTHAIDRGTGEG